MDIQRINNTKGGEPTPLYVFRNDEPTMDEYMEIIQRFQRHFPFIRVNSFGRSSVGHGANYAFYVWINKGFAETKSGRYMSEQHLETRGTGTMSLTVILAILEELGDLPEFVWREEE